MSGLSALLQVQELDLEADQLRARLEELASSRDLEQRKAEMDAIDAALVGLRERRGELAAAERALGVEVAALAEKAKGVETTLYSGGVVVPKELEALQADLDMLRGHQVELEDRELQQLEAIETLEGELADHDTRRTELSTQVSELESALGASEDEIRTELSRIAKARVEVTAGLPDPVLEVYERLRGNPRLAGRAAAPLGKDVCHGCRVQLPTAEVGRIRSEPPDAVVCCVGCGRLLVR